MEILQVPNLTVRGGVYYVKKKIEGRTFRLSTGLAVSEPHKVVLKAYQQLLDQIDRGADATVVPTFAEWWQTYYATISVKHADPHREEIIVGHVLPTWGALPMNDITKSMCERHLLTRAAQVKQGTVTRERNMLQALFERFIEEQRTVPLKRRVTMDNPFASIDRVADVARDRVLGAAEELTLRGVLSPMMQRWLTFMLGTGLRAEEARQCRAEDLDPSSRLLSVRATAAKGGKPRQVPLFDDRAVEQAVQQQLDAEGKLWHAHNYRGILGRCAAEVKLVHLSPHALRHTFGTRYLQRGGDIFILSKILGHSSVQVTEAHYVHLLKEDLVARSRHLILHGAVA